MGVVNTIILCPYHESLPIPSVHVYIMGLCLNNKSMSIQWVCTRSLILYLEFMSIPYVFVKSVVSFLYHEKYSLQIYRNTNNKNKEIQIFEWQKYNLLAFHIFIYFLQFYILLPMLMPATDGLREVVVVRMNYLGYFRNILNHLSYFIFRFLIIFTAYQYCANQVLCRWSV